MNYRFEVGHAVTKTAGFYGGPGVVAARFWDDNGAHYVIRLQVKDGFGYFYHVLTEKQLDERLGN